METAKGAERREGPDDVTMAQQHSAPELASHHYIASEHGGLEANPMSDGGQAPEVVPGSFYSGQEKNVADPYKQQYPGQWRQDTVPPQYPGTPAYNQGYGYPPSVQYDGQGGYSPVPLAGAPVPPEKPAPKLCGLPRRRALIIIAIGAVAVIAIIVGVAVGVTSSTKKSDSASPSNPSSSSVPTATDAVGCPDANNSPYTASGGASFIRYCGIDFGDNGEAKNINSVRTSSMAACMDACAAYTGCTGVGWGYMDGDTGTRHTCYMKSNLDHAHKAVPGWNFAVLQPSNLTTSDLAGGGTSS